MNLTIETIKLLAVLVASGAAIYGINSWRREARWKNKYQIAEQVLSRFYEARDIIKIIRHPLRTGEGETRKRGENESPEESRLLDMGYVATERFEKNKEVFNDLRKLKYRFMSLFGDDFKKPFDDLDEILNKILIASNRYWRYCLDHEKSRATYTPTQNKINVLNELEEIFISSLSEEDKIDKKVGEIIKQIEMICGKIISEK